MSSVVATHPRRSPTADARRAPAAHHLTAKAGAAGAALVAGGLGLGAVVTHDVPPYTVVAGVPARATARVVLDGDRVVLDPLPAG